MQLRHQGAHERSQTAQERLVGAVPERQVGQRHTGEPAEVER